MEFITFKYTYRFYIIWFFLTKFFFKDTCAVNFAAQNGLCEVLIFYVEPEVVTFKETVHVTPCEVIHKLDTRTNSSNKILPFLSGSMDQITSEIKNQILKKKIIAALECRKNLFDRFPFCSLIHIFYENGFTLIDSDAFLENVPPIPYVEVWAHKPYVENFNDEDYFQLLMRQASHSLDEDDKLKEDEWKFVRTHFGECLDDKLIMKSVCDIILKSRPLAKSVRYMHLMKQFANKDIKLFEWENALQKSTARGECNVNPVNAFRTNVLILFRMQVVLNDFLSSEFHLFDTGSSPMPLSLFFRPDFQIAWETEVFSILPPKILLEIRESRPDDVVKQILQCLQYYYQEYSICKLVIMDKNGNLTILSGTKLHALDLEIVNSNDNIVVDKKDEIVKLFVGGYKVNAGLSCVQHNGQFVKASGPQLSVYSRRNGSTLKKILDYYEGSVWMEINEVKMLIDEYRQFYNAIMLKKNCPERTEELRNKSDDLKKKLNDLVTKLQDARNSFFFWLNILNLW